MAAKKARKVKKKHAKKKAMRKAKATKVAKRRPAKKKAMKRSSGTPIIQWVRDAIEARLSVTTAQLRPRAQKAYPDSATVENDFAVLMARARRQLVNTGAFSDEDFIEAKGGRGIGATPKKKTKKGKKTKKVAKKKKIAKRKKKRK